MPTPVTYGTQAINSDELVSIRMSTDFKINTIDTFNGFAITTPANMSGFTWVVNAKFRKDTTTKFLAWCNEIQTRPMKTIGIFNRTYPKVYLTSLDLTATELNSDGDILFFDLQLTFIQNVNFTAY